MCVISDCVQQCVRECDLTVRNSVRKCVDSVRECVITGTPVQRERGGGGGKGMGGET